jgi:hypothetical protein
VTACPRCHAVLRDDHEPDAWNPHGLCDPCLRLFREMEQYMPEAPQAAPPDDTCDDPALLPLIAGLLAQHAALYPGERINVCAQLAGCGVVADRRDVHRIVNRLRQRHGMLIDTESARVGYALTGWSYLDAAGRRGMSVRIKDGAHATLCRPAGVESECQQLALVVA